VLMARIGVLAAPLVGLSVTIWHYLQMISAYLSVPLGAVIVPSSCGSSPRSLWLWSAF
jgi:hypothetical protein